MQKKDYKKEYSILYKASTKKATIIDVPKLQYITISGKGAPASELFTQSIQALYGIAYTITMSEKNPDFHIPNFEAFVCPPLEGHWSVQDGMDYDGIDHSVFKWDIRILMPDFITQEVFEQAIQIVSSKKENPRFKDVILDQRSQKKYCVMMHIGPFANEKETFDIMQAYTMDNGFSRTSKDHEEIYLSDFRKVAEEKLRTVLAFEVEK